MSGGRAEIEGDTKSEAGSRLWAVSPEPDTGLEITDREIMNWAEVGRLTDWATLAPQVFQLLWIPYYMLSIVLGTLYTHTMS